MGDAHGVGVLAPAAVGLAAAGTNAAVILEVFRDYSNGTIEIRDNVTVPEAKGC